MRAKRRARSLPGFAILLAAISLFAALGSCTLGGVTTSRHALVYGVSLYRSNYTEGIGGNLTYTDDDAVSMASLLVQYGWNADDIQLRCIGKDTSTVEKPTRAQMFIDIETLAATISSDDTVLLYFSGHGIMDAATEIRYFIPYEGISNDVNIDPDFTKCVSPADLSSELAKLPTNKVIVILDTCYSGGFVRSGSAIDTAPQYYGVLDGGTISSPIPTAISSFGELLAANATESGVPSPIVISAAGSLELSYEDGSPYGHGIFTYFLLAAASNADGNGDGYVTTSETYAYAVSGVKSSWNARNWNAPDGRGGHADYLPRISGGARDLVLFASK